MTLTPQIMIPDLLRRYPSARGVFDRYGLAGCGGRFGPVESIGFFARTHGVPEERLLAELQQAITGQALPPVAFANPVADTIYRRFFTAGIVLVLTAGATWGAWLLWEIGLRGGFLAVSVHQINAHGHAQVFGWVGLFIMGFAYQAFPRIWHTPLPAPRLAVAAFVLMVSGIVAGTAGMALAKSWSPGLPLAVAGGLAETAAVIIFVGQLLVALRRGNKPLEPYIGFVLAGLAFFVAMSAASLWHAYRTLTAADQGELVWYVATYQAPLRDLQIHGLALFMILGVSLRMLPALFGVAVVPHRRAWAALAVLTAAVLGEIGLFIAYRWTGEHRLAGLLMVPWLMLAAGVAAVAGPWRMWRPFPGGEGAADRSGKFVRAAYGWLAVSLAMLLLLPGRQWVSGMAFSHAYYGAIRHAITVGFISLMIMGFAAKVVPTLNGVDPRTLPALWGPFLLVNAGCLLRVSLQTLTDWYPGFFAAVGVSGTLEVAGLAWWGVGLMRIMREGRRQAALEARCSEYGGDVGALRAAAMADAAQPLVPLTVGGAPLPSGPPPADASAGRHAPSRIEPQHRVAEVLEWFPQTRPVFERFGFAAVRNPLLRRTVARHVTLAQATAMHGVPTEELIASLNQVITQAETGQAN